MEFRQYIKFDPNIRFGKPTIIRTCITVQDILGYMAAGMTQKEITEDFPELKDEQRSCEAYQSCIGICNLQRPDIQSSLTHIAQAC